MDKHFYLLGEKLRVKHKNMVGTVLERQAGLVYKMDFPDTGILYWSESFLERPGVALVAPLTYQGGKQRLAPAILDCIQPGNQPFFDLCCGSGAVSVELVNRGHSPEKITMLDKGPWGLFWKRVGDGTFDLDKFASYCERIPKDRTKIKAFMQELFRGAVGDDPVYVFLLLQASTFGGAAVWSQDDAWKKSGGFRSYWLPTDTSKRRHPVNPMMPMPDTLIKRLGVVCDRMRGVNGLHADIRVCSPGRDAVVYIDPPYGGTAIYGYTFDVVAYAGTVVPKCYVSEGKPLSNIAHLMSGGRKKGGMSGDRKFPHAEYLSELGGGGALEK